MLALHIPYNVPVYKLSPKNHSVDDAFNIAPELGVNLVDVAETQQSIPPLLDNAKTRLDGSPNTIVATFTEPTVVLELEAIVGAGEIGPAPKLTFVSL